MKNNNEITVRIKCDKKELVKMLEDKGFKSSGIFVMNDTYFVKEIKEEIRETLENAIIVRHIKKENKDIKNLTYKIKKFNEKGDILEQQAYHLEIVDTEEAKAFLKTLGYKELMNIKENDLLYKDKNIELAIKDIDSEQLLMEIETNEVYNNIDKLIKYINTLSLPISKNEYFVKKAEEAYKRKSKRN